MLLVRADLHVHTVLSPCGELDQSPGAVAEALKKAGVGLAAITDHNSAENAGAYGARLAREGIASIAGLEICTAEEAHVLGLFDSLQSALEMQAAVYQRLAGVNDPKAFGLQVIVNEDEDVLGFNERLLIGACSLTLGQTLERIHRIGGIAIACHVDREGFSVIGKLGFIPPDLQFDALEISYMTSPADAVARMPDCGRFPLVRSGDSHRPSEVARAWTEFLVDAPTVPELRKALRCEDGRRIERIS